MPVVRSVVGGTFRLSDPAGKRHKGWSLSELLNDHPWNLDLATKRHKRHKKESPVYGVGLVFADGEAEARGEGAEAAGLGLAAAAAITAGSILTVCEARTCHLPSRFA